MKVSAMTPALLAGELVHLVGEVTGANPTWQRRPLTIAEAATIAARIERLMEKVSRYGSIFGCAAR
jgi:hypothetical protein